MYSLQDFFHCYGIFRSTFIERKKKPPFVVNFFRAKSRELSSEKHWSRANTISNTTDRVEQFVKAVGDHWITNDNRTTMSKGWFYGYRRRNQTSLLVQAIAHIGFACFCSNWTSKIDTILSPRSSGTVEARSRSTYTRCPAHRVWCSRRYNLCHRCYRTFIRISDPPCAKRETKLSLNVIDMY